MEKVMENQGAERQTWSWRSATGRGRRSLGGLRETTPVVGRHWGLHGSWRGKDHTPHKGYPSDGDLGVVLRR